MIELHIDKNYKTFVQIIDVHPSTNDKIIKFYSEDSSQQKQCLTELILDYSAASRLIFELQKHFWYDRVNNNHFSS